MESINPATGDIIERYKTHTQDEIQHHLNTAQAAFARWKTTSFNERAQLLRQVADALESQRDDLAVLMTQEMGKLLRDAKAEVTKCAWVCRYYADHGEALLTPKTISTDARLSMVRYDPLGVILAIMPWNYPLWQVFRFAAPTLMAGNVGVLKHASNVSGCAQAITKMFEQAGFPKGLFQHLYLDNDETEKLIGDPIIRGVSLTGSLRAGRAVAKAAGYHCKPVLLELGGADPCIVLEDANLPKAIEVGLKSRFLNNGQSCIAAKRFIVHQDVYDVFIEGTRATIDEMIVGDPMDEQTTLGPMARDDLRDGLHEQVQKTIKQGAQCTRGGTFDANTKGFYYPPTLLEDVKPGMEGFDEELFGPVVCVTRARDTDHAIELANESQYGLGASLWTEDLSKALELIPQIESGNVFVNGLVKSDPRLPFGGIKNSGIGRELAQDGILYFVNVKTVWVG